MATAKHSVFRVGLAADMAEGKNAGWLDYGDVRKNETDDIGAMLKTTMKMVLEKEQYKLAEQPHQEEEHDGDDNNHGNESGGGKPGHKDQ